MADKKKDKKRHTQTHLRRMPFADSNHIASESIVPMHPGTDCDYACEMANLQIELVKLQEWIKHEKLRVVVLFEGRDAAGKGGASK